MHEGRKGAGREGGRKKASERGRNALYLEMIFQRTTIRIRNHSLFLDFVDLLGIYD